MPVAGTERGPQRVAGQLGPCPKAQGKAGKKWPVSHSPAHVPIGVTALFSGGEEEGNLLELCLASCIWAVLFGHR